MYTYILINFFTILFPVSFSFEKRVCFFKKWKYVLSAIVIPAVIFVTWDHIFTIKGVWGFNRKYLLGVNIFSLPLEEVLFFFCIPFACIFIYEIIRHFEKKDIFSSLIMPLATFLISMSFTMSIFNFHRIYTFVTFLSLSILLLVHILVIRSDYLGYFFQMYLISILPFIIVNGILTNGLRFIHSGPVVWYNSSDILSIRIINIPIEDFFYSMLLLLFNVTIYEFLKRKWEK